MSGDDVKVILEAEGLSAEQILDIVEESKQEFAAKGKQIAMVVISPDPEDPEQVIVKTVEKSPIKRIRRITGYLSTEDRFGDAKKAELDDRVSHVDPKTDFKDEFLKNKFAEL